MIRLWSIPSIRSWRFAQNHQKVFCPKYMLDDEDEQVKIAYRYMSDQMIKRLPLYSNVENRYPVWAWSQWYKNKLKPDLRHASFLPRGMDGVRIEFEIDEMQILLSDFDLWHAPLNLSYLDPLYIDGELYIYVKTT